MTGQSFCPGEGLEDLADLLTLLLVAEKLFIIYSYFGNGVPCMYFEIKVTLSDVSNLGWPLMA